MNTMEDFWAGTPTERIRELIGREPCCTQDTGGSHYHCGRCGEVSGMQGHFGRFCRNKTGPLVKDRLVEEWHFCCPTQGCELEEGEKE